MRNPIWASWASIGFAAMALALIAGNAMLQQQNQAMQGEINQRQLFINQSVQLGRVYEALLRDLATAAVNDKDDKLRHLLTQAGFTLTVNPAPTPAAPPTAPAVPPPFKPNR